MGPEGGGRSKRRAQLSLGKNQEAPDEAASTASQRAWETTRVSALASAQVDFDYFDSQESQDVRDAAALFLRAIDKLALHPA